MNKQVYVNKIINICDNEDIAYCSEYINQFVNESIDKKHQLYLLLKNTPNWDEDSYRTSFTVDLEIVPNVYDLRHELRNILAMVRSYSFSDYQSLTDIVYYIKDDCVVGVDVADILNKYMDSNISANKKLSKAISQFVEFIKVKYPTNDSDIKYLNSVFARFSDYCKSVKETKTIYLSINPYDFFTMSYGNGWSSCHGFDGCHRSGGVSYALDEVSIISYEENADSLKQYRQMVYYNPNVALFISRSYGYPITNMLEAVKSGIANTLQLPSNWIDCDTDYINKYFRTHNYSCHYSDYNFYYSEMSLFVNRDAIDGKIAINKGIIGHYAICFECGNYHDISDSYSCNECNHIWICSDCGNVIYNNDNVVFIDGEPYCTDCVAWCEDCEEYHPMDRITFIESVDKYVCDDCLSDNYSYCEDCDTWHPNNKITYVSAYDKNVCDDCICDNYFYCVECSEYFKLEDLEDTVNGDYICCDCRDKFYVVCNDCNYYVSVVDAIEDTDTNEPYSAIYICPNCK